MIFIGNTLRYVRFLDDFKIFPYSNLWTDTVTSGFADPKVYVVQTNKAVAERCILMTTDPGDLVLDPTCGSGTTAYVAERWGRRWITIDTSRVALTLARARLMGAKYDYYHLANSEAGAAEEAKLTGKPPGEGPWGGDIRHCFVYERAPHVMLKSIANNAEIDVIWDRYQPKLEHLRARLNAALFPSPVRESGRGEGTAGGRDPHPAASPPPSPGREKGLATDFATVVYDNLLASGVQNTRKGEAIKFEWLKPRVSKTGLVPFEGRYTEAGELRRAAICIGPEYDTVGYDLVRRAAREAADLYDTLIVCGFAFAPEVDESRLNFGSLTVLKARMNQDLRMGDKLKATGAGNLFVIFGEPDLRVHENADGMVRVEIKGMDIFDPTTGEVRSSGGSDLKNDVAAWFIDDDYNDESFFVRQAYFVGQDPFKSLKRALKAEIDDTAWEEMSSTISRPFPKPASGRICVKVINHFGDEVQKVFAI